MGGVARQAAVRIRLAPRRIGERRPPLRVTRSQEKPAYITQGLVLSHQVFFSMQSPTSHWSCEGPAFTPSRTGLMAPGFGASGGACTYFTQKSQELAEIGRNLNGHITRVLYSGEPTDPSMGGIHLAFDRRQQGPQAAPPAATTTAVEAASHATISTYILPHPPIFQIVGSTASPASARPICRSLSPRALPSTYRVCAQAVRGMLASVSSPRFRISPSPAFGLSPIGRCPGISAACYFTSSKPT